MKSIKIENLSSLFEALNQKGKVYLPVDNSQGGADYRLWESGTEWSQKTNTSRSPKDLFFPQKEGLMNFYTEGQKISIDAVTPPEEDWFLFGVRGCDVKAFEVLDNVFTKQQPADSYYTKRREHCTVLSCACTRPSETCFCHTFGIDCTNPEGDVTLWRTETDLYLSAITEKGENCLNLLSDILTDTDDKKVKDQQTKTKEILKKLPLANLSAEKFGGDKTETYFNRPEWDELSQSCIGCGTCTYVCPTCQCYDIKDYDTGHGIVRYRCWDSCMYSEFTKMSAGQPRPTQKERFRQRFMHKLVYYPANNDGLFSCVGCGRCLIKCPIQMNIVKVMKKLTEAEK